MAKVAKRDTYAKVICRLVGFVSNGEERTLSELSVRKQQLLDSWARYEGLHEQVLDRAGASEYDEQADTALAMLDKYIEGLCKYTEATE